MIWEGPLRGGPAREGPENKGELYRGLSNTNKVQIYYLKNLKTGEVIEFDKKKARLSRMRKRVFAWANTISEYLPAHGLGLKHRKVMITLTYAQVDDWRPNHIRDYIKELRRRLADNFIAYAWVGELQERGAVHYHIELIVKKGTRIPMPDKSGMWKHGSSRIETARTVFYICSYLKKAYQKEGDFPKGLRMFSVWISPQAVTTFSRWLFRLSSLPKWLSEQILGKEELKEKSWYRRPGGGWLMSGQLFRSPFQFFAIRNLPPPPLS